MANSVPDSQLEFNLGENETETSVSVMEHEGDEDGSVIETEQNTSPVVEEPAQEPEQKNELDTVSEAVQKRISKLTAKMREAGCALQKFFFYIKNFVISAPSLCLCGKILNFHNKQRDSYFMPYIVYCCAKKHII